MVRAGGVVLWHDYSIWHTGVYSYLNHVADSVPLSHIPRTALVCYHSRNQSRNSLQFFTEGNVNLKAIVTGANGMLGVDLCQELSAEGYQVRATDIQEMDVREPSQVRKVFTEFQPDVVFHLAALTNVDECEHHPDGSFRTNTIGTQNMALACQLADVPMVYISTISVFDGTKGEAYTEFDHPNPQSWSAVPSTKARKL